MTLSDLDCLYRPRSLAVIGASDRPGSISGTVTQNILEGFEGRVHLVNPHRESAFGRPCLRDLSDLDADKAPDGKAPDLAVVVTPADAVLPSVDAVARAGFPAALVISDPRRGSRRAVELRRALDEIVQETGLRINGPNCLGIATPQIGLNASMSRIRARPGTIAFVGQSATAAGPIVDWAEPRGLGFSHVISLGDMVDVDYADVLFYLAEEPSTRVIVLYAERLSEARRFLSAARHAARGKPVIVLKAGAMAPRPLALEAGLEAKVEDARRPDGPTPDSVYDAAFRRAGILRVRTLHDLFDAIEALTMRLPGDAPTSLGSRLAIMANGESMGMLALDSLSARGGTPAVLSPETVERLAAILPPGRPRSNPVDILPDATGERFAEALSILMGDKAIDAILCLAGPTGVASGLDMAQAVVDVVETARRHPGKRRPWIGTSWPGGTEALPARRLFADAHIPTFDTPSDAIAVFSVLNEQRRVQVSLRETPASVPEAFDVQPDLARTRLRLARDRRHTELSLIETATVLSAYGLLRDPPAMMAAGDAPSPIAWRIATAFDPEFGPVIRFGLTGPVAGLIDREVVALPPLNQTLARDVVLSHRAGAALCGPEGHLADGLTLDHIALALMQVSQMLIDLEDLAAVTLDPVRLWPGAVGLRWGKARIFVRGSGAPARSGARMLAIQPYPRDLETVVTLRGGRVGHLRPIRSEDEPALGQFQMALSDEDIRLRFFRMIRKNDHAFLVALTQIDYAWHMAFVLTGDGLPGDAEIFGVARLIRSAKANTGEYAIIVRSDLKGLGIGRLLMDRLIDYARSIGLESIYGIVLAENGGMLALNRKMGFTVTREPDDPGVLRVSLAL